MTVTREQSPGYFVGIFPTMPQDVVFWSCRFPRFCDDGLAWQGASHYRLHPLAASVARDLSRPWCTLPGAIRGRLFHALPTSRAQTPGSVSRAQSARCTGSDVARAALVTPDRGKVPAGSGSLATASKGKLTSELPWAARNRRTTEVTDRPTGIRQNQFHRVDFRLNFDSTFSEVTRYSA